MLEHARADLDTPDLLDLLHLDAAAFRIRFAGTPIARAKHRGLRRNVCVALGNTGDPAAIPALEAAAGDPDPVIAEHARWALTRLSREGSEPDARPPPPPGSGISSVP